MDESEQKKLEKRIEALECIVYSQSIAINLLLDSGKNKGKNPFYQALSKLADRIRAVDGDVAKQIDDHITIITSSTSETKND